MHIKRGRKHINAIKICIAAYCIFNLAGCITINNTTQQQNNTTQQPNDTTQQPNDTTQQPNDTTQQPNDTTQQPPVSTQQPPVRHQQPPVRHQQPPVAVPKITSVSPAIAENGLLTVTLKGSGFDIGAIVEVYDSSGKFLGSGIITKPKQKTSNTIVTSLKIASPGKYVFKVKNPDGHFSNSTSLTIPATQKEEKTAHRFTKEPRILYLGGGNAEVLFERYLSENNVTARRCSYDMKIKFYKNNIIKTVELDDTGMAQLFIEGPEDFVRKLKKKLKGQTAELNGKVVNDAIRENADYYIDGLNLAGIVK
jgi:hypothetical protein